MTDKVFLNADRSAVVDATGPGKKWSVSREEAVRLGLLDSADKPKQERRAAFDATKATAPVEAPKKTTRRKRK